MLCPLCGKLVKYTPVLKELENKMITSEADRLFQIVEKERKKKELCSFCQIASTPPPTTFCEECGKEV